MADRIGDTGQEGLAAAPPPVAGDRVRRAGWLLVGLLLVLEYGLFRQYAEREVVWGYPGGYDQTSYLVLSYQTFEQIRDQGLRQGLRSGILRPIANGMMLHVQGSVLYLLLGPSRLSALTLNFLYFALLQVVLVATVRWYAGRWSAALFALGLLLATATPFYPAGGLMDFRIDFIAGCLFGVFICLAVRSRLFASWGWSAAAGAAAAWLVAFRFLTTLYLAGILGSFFLLLCAALYLRRRDAAARRELLCRLRGLTTVGVLMLLLAAPVVWHNRAAIRRYYVDHLNNGESKERSQEFGIHNATDRLLYYPRSVARDHAGPRFLGLAGLALATALAAGRFRPAAPSAGPGARGAAAFAAACVAVPVLTLTLYSSPSPVVGGIVAPAMVWLVVALALWLARLGRAGTAGRVQTGWAVALAALTLLVGFAGYAGALSRRGAQSRIEGDVDQVLRLYDELARHSRECALAAPVLGTNDIREYLFPNTVAAAVYERHHVVLPLQPSMGTGIASVSEADALAAVGRSDFVIFNSGPLPEFADRPAPAYEYPFTKSMAAVRPRMLALCERDFIPLGHFPILGDDVILFGRPAVRVTGTTADGWVTSGGLTLTASGADLRRFPRIELRADAIALTRLGKVPAVRAEVQGAGPSSRALPATVDASGPLCIITVDLNPDEIPDQPAVAVRLSFDTSFCPHEQHPASEDCRHLVVRAPDSVRLLRGR
jgi:hypothetical protein